MSEAGDNLPLRQVLLALHAAQDPAALEAAAALAQLLRARIEGLLLEDADLLRLAALPFAREISLASALPRPLQAPSLMREMRAQAEAIQRLFEHQLTPRRLQWSFRVTQDRMGHIITTSTQTDYYVLGRPPTRSGEPHPVARGPVLAYYDGTPAAERALEVAAQLARHHGAELQVLLGAETDAAVRSRLRAQLEAKRVTARLLQLSDNSPHSLADACHLQHCALLVLGSGDYTADPTALEQLMERITAPVVVTA